MSWSFSRFATERTADTDDASLHRPSACASVTAAPEGNASSPSGGGDSSGGDSSRCFVAHVAGFGRSSSANPGVRVAACALYRPYTRSSSLSTSPWAPSTMPGDA